MDDKARLTELEATVALLMRAMGEVNKEFKNAGKAPLLDEQLLSINSRVASDLKGSNVPKVRRPDFGEPTGKTAA